MAAVVGEITICIPTYRRPELLKHAVESCLLQKYRPLQILIGDDSGDGQSSKLLAALDLPRDITLQLIEHSPPLRQARNVQWLMQHATGDRLLLLHDDDSLCEGGLDVLVKAWSTSSAVRCVYGKQYLISPDGQILLEQTEEFNTRYGRVKSQEGIQRSALSAGLTQQLPNNCFLVESALAKRVGYRTEEEVGHSVDADFGVRLGHAAGAGSFMFVDNYVSYYRLTASSILRTRAFNYGEHLFFSAIQQTAVPEEDQDSRDLLLRRISARAVLNAAMTGDRSAAFKILTSKYYDLPYTDKRTLFRLCYIVWPSLGGYFMRFLSDSR
jgi:glycosyltransferase involved in cell wall biosynthesis